MSLFQPTKTVVLRLAKVEDTNLSIEAVQRALDGKTIRGADIAPLMGVISILEAIRDYDKPREPLMDPEEVHDHAMKQAFGDHGQG